MPALIGPTAVAAVIAFGLMADAVVAERAVDGVATQARASAVLLASSFRRELETFRLVSVVLADDREAREALRDGEPQQLAAMNRKLEALSQQTRAAAIYLMDSNGRTVAASNWSRPDSFVGASYAFRSYFKQAITRGEAQQFALGTKSKRPGLYLSDRVGDGDRPLGVIVVKVEFDALEAEWRQIAAPAFAVDRRGVILVTADPAWRFETIRPLSLAERERARRSLEFGAAPLTVNALFARGVVGTAGTAASRRPSFVQAVEKGPGEWRVHVLAPTRAAVGSAITSLRLATGVVLLIGAGLYLLWRHRRRTAAARMESEANARLAVLNERLMRANKLAMLGQVAAGVGHEISQPVAAIAAFAHNARELVTDGQGGEAVVALDRISGLTARIGVITRELRGFSRRTSRERVPVLVDEVVDGTQLLLRDRLRSLDVRVLYDRAIPPVRVMAEQVRLEQVLVNLLQNAIDAGARTISIDVTPRDGLVDIAVADDGPGLSPEARRGLFQPFTTSKSNGLGLGLVISRDLATELGGSLEAGSPEHGAEFIITLERAP